MSVKETTEILAVAKLVTLEVTKAILKDGFQWDDLGAYLKSPDFDKAVLAAVDGAEKAPGEVVGLSNPFNLFDDVALAKFCYTWATDIAAVIRSQKKTTAA